MTSLLRDDVSVPIVSAASIAMTDRPESASARATASPTTPAPTTIASVSITRPRIDRGLLAQRRVDGERPPHLSLPVLHGEGPGA